MLHDSSVGEKIMTKSKNEYLLKICIIGNPTELKTEFIRNYAENKFTTNYVLTQGVDITTKTIQVNNNMIKLILVDTASQEFFAKLRPSYYRGASAVIICFEKSTIGLKEVTDWVHEFRKHIPDSSVPMALLCFNTGLDEISTKEGQLLAKKLGANYCEVTTQLEVEVADEIFKNLTRRALASKEAFSILPFSLRTLLSRIIEGFRKISFLK